MRRVCKLGSTIVLDIRNVFSYRNQRFDKRVRDIEFVERWRVPEEMRKHQLAAVLFLVREGNSECKRDIDLLGTACEVLCMPGMLCSLDYIVIVFICIQLEVCGHSRLFVADPKRGLYMRLVNRIRLRSLKHKVNSLIPQLFEQ